MLEVNSLVLLDAIRSTMMAVCCATGILVGVDSIAILASYPEKPPHRPKANAFAWLVAAISVTGFTSFIIIRRMTWIGPQAPVDAKVAMLLFLTGLAAAFTARAVTRARKPWLTVLSAVLMSVLGTILALVDST